MILNLENSLKYFFQKNLILSFKTKTYKKGKLINFKLSGCYISFVMQTEKKREIFEIPFPFAIKTVGKDLVFDYTLNSLAEQDYELLINLRATSQIKKCKFYNTTLTITPLN